MENAIVLVLVVIAIAVFVEPVRKAKRKNNKKSKK